MIMRSTTFAAALMGAASVAAAVTPTRELKGVQSPVAFPVLGAAKSHGCYASPGELKNSTIKVEFMAMGSCTAACVKQNKLVSGLHGNDCICGDKYPPASKIVDDKNCNYPCLYYDKEACGGLPSSGSPLGFYSIFNNGIELSVAESADDPNQPSSTGGSGGDSPASTSAAPTATVTQTSAPSSGPNVGGIVAGVVVAILVVAGLVGGAFFYLRRKRNKELEDEHRRTAAVNAFIHGGKPGSSGGMSAGDSRLDPVMAQRRLSDGSIADNQDYSRKILRVTNA